MTTAQQRRDDLQRFFESIHATIEWQAKRAILGLVPASADAQDQSAAATSSMLTAIFARTAGLRNGEDSGKGL